MSDFFSRIATAVRGRTSSAAVAAGYVGEVLSDTATSAPSLTTTNVAAAASKSFTAGTWLIWGGADVAASGSNLTQAIVAVGSSTDTSSGTALPSGRGKGTTIGSFGSGSSSDFTINSPPILVTLSAATTYYTVARATFATGTATATGYITGVRVA